MDLKIHAYSYHSIMCLLVTEFMVTDTMIDSTIFCPTFAVQAQFYW